MRIIGTVLVTVSILLVADGAWSARDVAPAPNGIAYPRGWEDWRVVRYPADS
jgi:hypothetical protein